MNTELTNLENLANRFDSLTESLQYGSFQKLGLVFRTAAFETIKPHILANAVHRSFNNFENYIFESFNTSLNRKLKRNWKIHFPRILFKLKCERFFNASYVNVITYMPKEILFRLFFHYEKEFSIFTYKHSSLVGVHAYLDQHLINNSTFTYMQETNENFSEWRPEFNIKNFSLGHSHLDFGQNSKNYLESKPRIDANHFHHLLNDNLEKSEGRSFREKFLLFKGQMDDLILNQSDLKLLASE